VLPASKPVHLSIPRLQVGSPLERLGVDGAGVMDVPGDPARAGWYDLGPTPGSLGPAVITGHVTWNGTRGVFFALAALRRGDVVRVDRADGRTAVFEVRRVAQFQKTHFPTRAVFGPVDRAALRLITCGGTYDAAAHRYLANTVVFATLVSAR
jgi:sortase (surface protein transpeptidase)